MKKIIFVLAALLAVVTSCSVAFAEQEVDVSAEEPVTQAEFLDAQQFVQQLCRLNTGDHIAVRTFLKQQFAAALGIGVENVNEQYFGVEDVSGHNIEAVIDSPAATRSVVIGAHYDCVGEGANDNVCGVAALMQIAHSLAQCKNLPFDIRLVAFDCEESGMVGSTYYVTHQIDPDEVAVMFNIDTIAAGKNLYVMCENQHTDLADLVLSQSSELTEKPHSTGVYNMDVYGYGYFEFVQNTDYTSFRLADVPSVCLFSGSYGILGYEDDSGVLNTDADTLNNLVSVAPQYAQRIKTVADAIVGTVTAENFAAVAENAHDQLVNNGLWYNHWWPALIVLGVLVILAIGAWLYSRKLQKRALLGTAEVKNNNIFEKPQADDIFSFENTDSKNSSDDKNSDGAEDIFTFKK